MSDIRQLAEKRANLKIKFYKSFTVYIIVNAILAVINALFTPEYWWVMFPVVFWGIGVFVRFLKAFVFPDKFDNEKYREHKIEEEMEKLRK